MALGGQHAVESRRRAALTPCGHDRFNVVLDGACPIDLEVVGAMHVNGFMVPARFALPAVPAEALPPLELVHWTMNPDEVDVKVRKPRDELRHPARGLDDVLDDEVVARPGERRQASVKAVEERGAQVGPCEIASLDAIPRQDTRAEVVDRVVPEGRIDT